MNQLYLSAPLCPSWFGQWAIGNWQLANGNWQLAIGNWQLTNSDWRQIAISKSQVAGAP
jgi:hypothetical protein